MEILTLESVLEAFNAPVNEEQGWSICYQCAKYLCDRWLPPADAASGLPADCRRFSGLKSVQFGKDGTVTAVTATGDVAQKEYDLVQSLGVVVFQALDYGLSETEEQTLSPALESLLERMTVSGSDEEDEDEEQTRVNQDTEGDEGIDAGDEDAEESEAMSRESFHLSLAEVMELCSQHLPSPKEAPTRFKAVCRALVTEAGELLTFLEKISAEKKVLEKHGGKEKDSEASLNDLERADWARLWMQIMRELRYGAKLKKVEQQAGAHQRVEFELTPYEILMEDIRSRRYTLNKVMVNGAIPARMKKDAHDVILEFIRSRPPLHSAKDRKLRASPPREEDPREKLMKSIRSEPRLKPTPGRVVETSRTKLSEDEDTPGPTRKVIKPDLSLLMSDDEEDFEDFEDEEDGLEDRNKVTPSPLDPLTPLSPARSRQQSVHWQQTVARDLDLPDHRNILNVSACVPQEFSLSQGALFGPTMSGPQAVSLFAGDPSVSEGRSLQSSLECLSLTIEEVMHIRSVLTKAELECLLVNLELYELVSKGKICFTCKTTRFSLFGQWSTKCRFCKRSVCAKCYSKMRIPTEHFEHIPVYTLSPSPIGSESEDFFVCEKTGSVPSSPDPKLRTITLPPDIINNNGHGSRPRRAPLQRSQTVMKPPPPARILQGPLMNVCKDCKAMIVSIIRSSRSSLATAPITPREGFPDCPSRRVSRNFHLDLKPVYKGPVT